MNLDKVTQWISLLGNVGVIAGIVFLGLEIQQNNELLSAQTRRDQHESRMAAGGMEITNGDIAHLTFKVRHGEELTPFEYHRFEEWARFLFANWEWQYDEYRAGMLAESDLPIAGWADRETELPLLRELWHEIKGNRSPEFIQFIEQHVFSQ